MNSTTRILAALSLPLLLAACGPDGETNDTLAPDPGEVVATVNDRPVTETDLDAQIQAMTMRGQPATRGQALDELVDIILLTQRAEERAMHEQPDIKAELRRQRDSLLANQLLRAELEQHEPSDADIEAEYERRYGDDAGRNEYHARHILLESTDDAEAVIGALDGGADFAELAQEHSVGPSASIGGDLDWFQLEEVVEPFADAVEALEIGAYTAEPVETRFGWHVIQLEDMRPQEAPELAEVRDEIMNALISSFVNDYIESLRAESEVEIR